MTAGEGPFFERSDRVWNEYLFNVAAVEPTSFHGLESFREAQHLRILLGEAKLLSRHPYVRGKAQIGYSSPPETEQAELLDIRVQLECFQATALPEGNCADSPQ